MADALSQFGYQSGVATGDAIKGAVAPLEARLDALDTDLTLRQRIAWLDARLPTAIQSSGSGLTAPTQMTTANLAAVTSKPDRGMSATDGRKLGKAAHIRQSLSDIFRTPVGSRVLRRDYGSNLPDLVDAPMNDSVVMSIIVAAAGAAEKWESRVTIHLVKILGAGGDGKMLLGIGATDDDGNPITFEGVYAS